MKTSISAYAVHFLQVPVPYKIKIEIPEKCPCCGTAYALRPEAAIYYESDEGTTKAYCTFFCPACEEGFFVSYDVIDYDGYDVIGIQYETFPFQQANTVFSKEITSLSPNFVKIYQQAEQAENQNLHDICGLGYRKALEFLIKDFAIHEHPDEEEPIKAKPLAQCIKSYITDERITTLAERSSWIGNDEAHYIRKQEDRDVSDMKSFIKAIVYFIGMILVTEDAASMLPKK